MFSTSDSWLGIGVVVMIGVIVVGLSTGIGKVIIWIFGTGHEPQKHPAETSRR